MKLEQSEIAKHLSDLKKLVQEQSCDVLYVSSFDHWINEYVPLEDCLRYYASGFTGSVAELLVPAQGKALLFVDGRYHEQADREVDASQVEVVKVPYGVRLVESMQEIMELREMTSVGIIAERTPYALGQKLGEKFKVVEFEEAGVLNLLNWQRPQRLGDIEILDEKYRGQSTIEKLRSLVSYNEGFFISALDSIAWLSNCRGYQLPYQSTFRARALATNDLLYIYLDDESFEQARLLQADNVRFKKLSEMNDHFEEMSHILEKVYFDPGAVNYRDWKTLVRYFARKGLDEKPGAVVALHAIKDAAEIRAFEESFEKSDTAIFNTLTWLKQNGDTSFSELQFYKHTEEFYREQGARCQSFKTISALGSNSSVVHFSSPSDRVHYEKGQLALLDSGAFYDGGVATDCTRTVLPGGKATKKQKEIYTAVLKSLLNIQHAVFKVGTLGKELDKVARDAIAKMGYEYAHGTGHGIGVNVHEGGYSITPVSEVPLQAGLVGSLEPGIYIGDYGGVRLENVVVVEEHPEQAGMLRFRSLIHIGFDWDLIDESLLTADEKKWLDEYESICKKKGRSFKNA